MPRFAANLSMMFTEVPLLERFERAARAGFRAVEVQFPYEAPAPEVAARLQASGLPMVLHNLPAGDAAKGERGIACDPARVEEFRQGVVRAIEYATALDVPRLNCLAGIPPDSVDEATRRRTLVANLRHAAAALKAVGKVLVVEPINTYDVPGFWLNRTEQAIAVLDEVGADNAFVQYDLYHAQRMEGELCGTLTRRLDRIGHVQIADNPGRHEPGTGEVNWAHVLGHLDRIGYTGWVGCEYKPAGRTEDGLGWMAAFA